VCTSITSGLMGLVGIFSPNFFRPRDELWSTNEKVTARILVHPNCSYTVSWRKSICQVVLFGVTHELPLLREEFRIPELTFHSDLRRRVASRRALPCPSSFMFYCMFYFTCDRSLLQRSCRSVDPSSGVAIGCSRSSADPSPRRLGVGGSQTCD